jgi:hypothetical protein
VAVGLTVREATDESIGRLISAEIEALPSFMLLIYAL